jgi:hypothetical protein
MGNPVERTIGIRSLRVAAPFEGRAFVYRTGEFAYKRDSYAAFMVSPAEGLVSPIGSWWRGSGGFREVVDGGSALKPGVLVEIQVARLYGDFRPAEPPAAVLDMSFVFFDAPNGVPGTVLLRHEYSRRIPLKARAADDLIAGWNEALALILESAMEDFGKLEPSGPPAAPSTAGKDRG